MDLGAARRNYRCVLRRECLLPASYGIRRLTGPRREVCAPIQTEATASGAKWTFKLRR